MHMKTTLLISLMLIIGNSLFSQDFTPYRVSDKTDRELKKEKKAQEAEDGYNRICALIDSMHYVLEANRLSNKYGQSIMVSSSLNYISVDSVNTVIQTGNNAGMGYNGVGGVTAVGKPTKYEVVRNAKNRTIMIRMDVFTGIGIYNIVMDVNSSGHASAILTGLGSGRLTYYGEIVPRRKSRIFKGMTSY
jgi:hypothetical protein